MKLNKKSKQRESLGRTARTLKSCHKYRSFAGGAKHEARPEKIRSSNTRNIEIYSLTWRTEGGEEKRLYADL